MDTTASRFTLRKNAERAARTMIRKGTAPAVDYGIKSSDDGFEIVWKIANTAPTTDEVETEIAEASADQPAAASLAEAGSQPAPAATKLATTAPHRGPRQRLRRDQSRASSHRPRRGIERACAETNGHTAPA